MGKTRPNFSKTERAVASGSGGSGFKQKTVQPSSSIAAPRTTLTSALKTSKTKYNPHSGAMNPNGTFNVPLNLSSGSGKITKRKSKSNSFPSKSKKNVTFRPNLTDILAAGEVLKTSEKIKLKLGEKNKKFLMGELKDSAAAAASLLSSCTELNGQMKKILKTHVPAKKNRLKIKRETFQKKIELLKKSVKEEKAAKKRQETVIVGDMQPMLQALETELKDVSATSSSRSSEAFHPLSDLQSFVAGHKLEEFKSIPKKNKLNMKKRQQEIAQGLEYFAQGMSEKNLPIIDSKELGRKTLI